MGNNFDEAIAKLNHFICLDDALNEIAKITGLNIQKNAELLLNFIRDEKRPENHTQGEFGLRVFSRNKIYGWTEAIGHQRASAWCELTDLAFDGTRQRRLPGEIGFCRDEFFLFLRERGLEIGGHADEPVPLVARRDDPQVRVHKIQTQRQDILTPLIVEAVEKAGCFNYAKVFPLLREMALNGRDPFNNVDRDGFRYTDDDGAVDVLTTKALRERLKRMEVNSHDKAR